MEKFIIKETEKAYQIKVKVENCILEKQRIYSIWIPKSALKINEEGQIEIAQWVIAKNILKYDGDIFKGFVV